MTTAASEVTTLWRDTNAGICLSRVTDLQDALRSGPTKNTAHHKSQLDTQHGYMFGGSTETETAICSVQL